MDYCLAGRRQASLAMDAIQQALARRGGTAVVDGCVARSDRGSLFRSALFQDGLTRHGLVGKMAQVSSAGDNAAMESFLALLQKNMLGRHGCVTRDESQAGINTWVEKAYHQRRKQGRLTG